LPEKASSIFNHITYGHFRKIAILQVSRELNTVISCLFSEKCALKLDNEFDKNYKKDSQAPLLSHFTQILIVLHLN